MFCFTHDRYNKLFFFIHKYYIFFFCRTHCANEEENPEEEVEQLFPNYANADFSEYATDLTLDKKKAVAEKPVTNDIIAETDLQFIANCFIEIMFNYARYLFLNILQDISHIY